MDLKECNNKCNNECNNENYKEKYGDVPTPYFLIKEMLNLIPSEILKKKDSTWLDPGCGEGNFGKQIYEQLMYNLTYIIDINERKKHIMKQNLYLLEKNEYYKEKLEENISKEGNIIMTDYLTWEPPIKFDVIIGNPPYNSEGMKKTPTNKVLKKGNDGETLWIKFVKKSVDNLKEGGYLCFIIPSIWLKPDRAKMYHYLTQYKLHKIKCFSNTETNKIFNNNAQTPSCFFLLQKRNGDNKTMLYDKLYKTYMSYDYKNELPIPVHGVFLINKLKPYVDKYGSIENKVIKTNCISNKIKISKEKTEEYSYKNVTTCLLENNKATLVVNYSDNPCNYWGKKKLILAHKMYGFPFFDEFGEYGISSRDNYVMLNEDYKALLRNQLLLSTKFAIYLFESTRYRMKYLEKYVFQFIPDISNIPDFPNKIDDDTLCEYFGLNKEEKEEILMFNTKPYKTFISKNEK